MTQELIGHPINRMDELTLEQLLAKMDQSVHDAIRERYHREGTIGLVLFENQDLCSSRLGERSVLPIGEPWTYKTIEETAGKWLHDLPSQRQYAVAYVRKPAE